MSIQDIIIKIKGRVGDENLCKIRLILPFVTLGASIILLLCTSFLSGRVLERRMSLRPPAPIIVELPPYLEPYEAYYGSGKPRNPNVDNAAVRLAPTSSQQSISATPTSQTTPKTTLHETKAFVTSKTGKVYYPATCKSVNRIKPENRVYYQSSSELIARGYTLSKTCVP